MIRLYMGKRLACPRCEAVHEYDVPTSEVTAPLREVRCRACGHRFSYGFAPEYVTEAEGDPGQSRPPEEPYDAAVDTPLARERLARHVARYTEYHDRDRDILLLHLLDMADHLDRELATVKRAIDVLVKRSPRP